MGATAGAIELLDADTEACLPTVRTLFCEYADWLQLDLEFQSFGAELASLPGAYARARGGAILLAQSGGEPAGCVALRALEPGVCEMKRLWVRERFRNLKLGSRLAQAILERAAANGYRVIRLDTLAHMQRARQLYLQLGFREIPPYYASPLSDAIYLERPLRP
jgi:putative acetyltransferase